MKLLKSPSKFTYIYSAASIFIGPLVYILGYGFTRGGGDYCDGIYYLPGGVIDPQRITEFQNAQVFQVTGASIMLALGFAIIIYSILHSRKKESKFNVWSILAVLFMMLGYVAVIVMSGKAGQAC